jgi:hypothetical protein
MFRGWVVALTQIHSLPVSTLPSRVKGVPSRYCNQKWGGIIEQSAFIYGKKQLASAKLTTRSMLPLQPSTQNLNCMPPHTTLFLLLPFQLVLKSPHFLLLVPTYSSSVVPSAATILVSMSVSAKSRTNTDSLFSGIVVTRTVSDWSTVMDAVFGDRVYCEPTTKRYIHFVTGGARSLGQGKASRVYGSLQMRSQALHALPVCRAGNVLAGAQQGFSTWGVPGQSITYRTVRPETQPGGQAAPRQFIGVLVSYGSDGCKPDRCREGAPIRHFHGACGTLPSQPQLCDTGWIWGRFEPPVG